MMPFPAILSISEIASFSSFFAAALAAAFGSGFPATGLSGFIRSSLFGPASVVAGSVERSVIGRGAVVEEGATVREAVILPGAVVRSGASVVRAVVDDEVEVAADVGEEGGEIALVGMEERVTEPVPAGGRFPEVEAGE